MHIKSEINVYFRENFMHIFKRQNAGIEKNI